MEENEKEKKNDMILMYTRFCNKMESVYFRS